MPDQNSKGREENAAQPLGQRKGTSSKADTEATGKAERHSAGPDGPRAEEVSRTFKRGA
jgi:hypothetical protein